jgi:hypothetical protein
MVREKEGIALIRHSAAANDLGSVEDEEKDTTTRDRDVGDNILGNRPDKSVEPAAFSVKHVESES